MATNEENLKRIEETLKRMIQEVMGLGDELFETVSDGGWQPLREAGCCLFQDAVGALQRCLEEIESVKRYHSFDDEQQVAVNQ